MTDPSSFDFGAFNINTSDNKNFDSFWQRDSVKNDNNSFFSNESDKEKDKQPQKHSQINQISIGAFGDPQSPSLMKSSGISKRFNIEKQSQEDVREPAINLSRSINDIDLSDFERKDGAYHYQKEIPYSSYPKDDNYEILKKMISQPKKMDFDNFFTNLQKNKEVANDSFLNKKQYSNKQQLEEHIRKVKLQKRQQQEMRQKNISSSVSHNQFFVPKVLQINYFKKKPNSSNILEEDMVRFNNQEAIQQKQLTNSKKFIQFKPNNVIDQKLPLPPQIINIESGEDFFKEEIHNMSQQSSKAKQSVPIKSKLPVIIDADQNIFQTTQEEIKLNNLFDNFKKLMDNYTLLRGELKSNTEGQQKIMKEIYTLNNNYNKDQQAHLQRVKNQQARSSRQMQQKEYKHQTKQKINQIQIDIYKKIENLQNVVKETFDKQGDEKNNLVWVNPDFKQITQRQIHQNSQSSQQRPPQPIQLQKSTHNNHISPSKDAIFHDIMSPLDLRLNINNEDYNKNSRVSQSKSIAFSPQKIKNYDGQCYQPQRISVDSFYKKACIQDHTIIFQSFDFIVSAKYNLVRVGRKHLKISITIKNKTILALNDFMVIMYGSLGQILQISPSKMYVEKFNPEESKTLEALLYDAKSGNQPIRMQISYKTQRDRKGKVSIKIPRPITKFMDMKFTHQDQFNQIWSSTKNQIYLSPRSLNFQIIKSTDDIKLIFPFIDINQIDDRQFSYGLIFSLLNMEGLFLLKLVCDVEGSASVHIRFDNQALDKYGKEVLDTINLIMFS